MPSFLSVERRRRPTHWTLLRRLLTPCAAMAIATLAGCMSPAPQEQVVRSIPPHNPEVAITNYFDITVRGGDKNRELTVGTPQRGGCPMGGTAGGYVGWVVPVEYKTRSKDNGTVIVSSYFFWFSDETIRGVTRRMEVCP